MARRFATRIDSQKNLYFQNARAIRAHRLKPEIRSGLVPRRAIRKKEDFVRESSGNSPESSDSRESANQFARIGPSKTLILSPAVSGPQKLVFVLFVLAWLPIEAEIIT